jgi:hypothetical protein
MGAWDTTAFGNDDAADWALDLKERDEPAAFVSEALGLARGGDYLESADGAVIVAAAAVVASACDGTARLLPPDLAVWLRGREKQIKPLASAAVAALARVSGEESELRELWADSHELPEWTGLLETISESLRA